MDRHVEFLAGVEEWFARLRSKQGGRMKCGRGCSLCCRGLFDISLPDALLLAEGLSLLPQEVMSRVKEAAIRIQDGIAKTAPELPPPHFLHVLSEEKIDAIVDGAQCPPCALLGADGQCLVYKNRPLACRLEGAPMVDLHDGLFGDWCELNFTDGVPDAALADLTLDYCRLQETEQLATEILSETALNDCRADVTVFIPSIVADFDSFWKAQIGSEGRSGT